MKEILEPYPIPADLLVFKSGKLYAEDLHKVEPPAYLNLSSLVNE